MCTHGCDTVNTMLWSIKKEKWFFGPKLPKEYNIPSKSPAVGDFYGTGIEIWAGFGPVRQLLRPVFSCFHEQKKF